MSLDVKQGMRFTAQSFEEMTQIERRIRQRTLNLLEDLLREENRETISVDDVHRAYSLACKELTGECASAK